MAMVDEVKRPIPIILGIFAVVGWIFALVLLGERTNLRIALTDQTEAVGTIEKLQGEANEVSSEVEALVELRDEINAEITTQQSNLSSLQDDVATAQSSLDQAKSEQSAIEDQIAPMREEIAGFDAARAEAEKNMTDATQALAEVGDRLTEARETQAALQQQLSLLTDDTSRLAQEASDTEARVQEARDAEAASQAAVATATEQLDRITAERDTVSKALEDLTQRRDHLAADNTVAEEQRQSVQAIVTQLSDVLASRSQHLSDIEQRIADLQDPGTFEQGSQDSPMQEQEISDHGAQARSEEQAAMTLEPGYYTGRAIEMMLAEDGRFTLSNADRGEEVTGRYEVSGGQLTLSDAEGDVGTTTFPMTCGIQRAETGFAFAQVGEQICPLAGLELETQ